jgi:uncharacterized small protein (DUF1192 family)
MIRSLLGWIGHHLTEILLVMGVCGLSRQISALHNEVERIREQVSHLNRLPAPKKPASDRPDKAAAKR